MARSAGGPGPGVYAQLAAVADWGATEMKREGMILLPDTNVLIHFTTFDEAPWQDLVDGPVAGLYLVPVVLEELNKLKDSSRVSRVKKRAKTILRKLHPLVDAPEMQREMPNGVLVKLVGNPPALASTPKSLTMEREDDRLLGTALAYQASGKHCSIVTNDFHVRVKAKAMGIRCTHPPAPWKLQLSPTEEESELARLKDELRQLKNARPRLSIQFRGENGRTRRNWRVLRTALRDEIALAVDERIALLETSQCADRPAATIDSSGRRGTVVDYIRALEAVPVTDPGWGIAIAKYRQRCTRYLEARGSMEAANSRFFPLELEVQNIGSMPGSHLVLSVALPAGFRATTFYNPPKMPSPPDPPVPGEAWGAIGAIWDEPANYAAEVISRSLSQLESGQRALLIGGPTVVVDPQGTQHLEFTIDRLAHGRRWEPIEMWIEIPESLSSGAFRLTARVACDELPKAVEETLVVVLEEQAWQAHWSDGS